MTTIISDDSEKAKKLRKRLSEEVEKKYSQGKEIYRDKEDLWRRIERAWDNPYLLD